MTATLRVVLSCAYFIIAFSTGPSVRSYFCVVCQVAWPFTIHYRKCPGCLARCVESDHEALHGELAEDIAATLTAEREMDEADIDRFRREMDRELGPSAAA